MQSHQPACHITRCHMRDFPTSHDSVQQRHKCGDEQNGFVCNGLMKIMWRCSLPRLGRSVGRRPLHSGPDNLQELLDKHVAPSPSKKPATPQEGARRLTSTRREALSLYREILRASRHFIWRNEQGIPWRDVLRASARKEFEEARFESDPEIIAKLLVGGRDALQQVVDKAVNKQKEALDKTTSERDR